MVSGRIIYYSKSRLGACSVQKCMSSPTQSSAQVLVRGIQPEDPGLCIGRPIAFPEITPPPPPDRLHPGQPDSARLGIRRPIAFQSPSVRGKDTSRTPEIHSHRWKTLVRCWPQRKKFARAKDDLENIRVILRSETLYHGIDGACRWCLIKQKVRERFPNIDPKFTANSGCNS